MGKDHWPTLHDDKYARLRLKRSCELLKAMPNHRILDVGCHQEEARQYLPANSKYVGLDHIKGDNFDGGFNLHQKFDRILCLEVLEHLMYPKKTLKAISDHLEKDGIAVISLPNEATLFHRIRSFLGTPDQEAFSECGKHLHLPSMRQSKSFVSQEFQIASLVPYESDGAGSAQQWMQPILRCLPLKLLSIAWPSLFARGFIFMGKSIS